MNAVAEILEHLRAIDGELHELLKTPMRIETAEQRLERLRAGLLARHGGSAELRCAHALAVADLYADQASGRTLD